MLQTEADNIIVKTTSPYQEGKVKPEETAYNNNFNELS